MPLAVPSAPLLLAVALAAPGRIGLARAPTSDPAPTSEPAPASEPQEFRAARVDIVGFDEAAVLAALRLRLPRLPIERHGGPAPAESPHVYLELRRLADDAGALRIITSDGRAYERAFAVEIGQEVRVAASTAASLIFAVEQGAVAPDREDVAIPPAPDHEEPPPPAHAPSVAEPPPEKTGSEGHVLESTLPPPPTPPARPPWELGVLLHGAAALGLGPPAYADLLAGGGGGLGLEVRGPRGFAAALEARGLGRARDGVGLGRLRLALAAGYALRRGRFELPVLLALAIEPWWTTRAGALAPVLADATATARPPLIGGFLRVAPGVRLALARRPLAGLRIGPRLELGGAFVVDDGARVVGLADPDGAPRFRLGGLELSIGLEVALQFGLPSR